MTKSYIISGVRGATGKRGDSLRADRLAVELSLPVVPNEQLVKWKVLLAGRDELAVVVNRQGAPAGGAQGNRLKLDWTHLDTVSAAGRNRRQPLLKAVLGKRKPGPGYVVLDCTAGLGEDAWLLTALGCSVIAVERNPVLFALVRDAWARIGIEQQIPARRFRIVQAEARDVLISFGNRGDLEQRAESVRGYPECLPRPDTVYLDPMFPGHLKRKTAEKKSMRLARAIVGECRDDSEALLDLALKAAGSRVVLKRPRKAPVLCSESGPPTHQITGRGMRYDIYIQTS
ncbi:MAG: class I SAM-dependent methyltransferase [Desulfohalobiaceae bacterium]|nr:class I SAM-dependent methyltransferase [Desulfohalobiaceae bacterium]